MYFELVIEIAGITTRIAFDGLNSEQIKRLKYNYSAFFSLDRTPVMNINAHVDVGDVFLPNDGGVLQIRSWRDLNTTHFISHREHGWFDLRNQRGELIIPPGGSPENFLRVMYSWLALEHGALLVHASGVIRRGRGYAFFGPSGSGKTTITRLSKGDTILSDDMIIIKCSESNHAEARLIGTPFHGNEFEAPIINRSSELQGLYCLVKDHLNSVSSVRKQEAIARLASCVPFIMSQSESAHQVLELCQRIVESRPVQELHFRKDPDFWSVIDG